MYLMIMLDETSQLTNDWSDVEKQSHNRLYMVDCCGDNSTLERLTAPTLAQYRKFMVNMIESHMEEYMA